MIKDKQILNLRLRRHILGSCRFVAEVTSKFFILPRFSFKQPPSRPQHVLYLYRTQQMLHFCGAQVVLHIDCIEYNIIV